MENEIIFKLTDIQKNVCFEFEKSYTKEKENIIIELKKILKEKYNIIL